MINKKIIFLFLLFLLILICITGSAQAAETDTMSHTYQTWLQMNTCWENPDQAPNPYWGYAENIGDGRGITCGFIGFCTGTGDANEVVKYYTTLNPSNVLAKYIPALNAIDAGPHNDDEQGDGNDDLTGLTNFISDWEKADRDDHNTFTLAQLHVMDEIYWTDTVSQYTATGCQHPVSLAIMASINTRFGNDGLQSCVSYAKSQAGGTPGTGKNEKTFDKYMSTKFKNLGAGDDDTTRIDSFIAFTTSGNKNLNTPFQYTNDYGGDVPYTITGDLGLTAIVTPVVAFTISPASGTNATTFTFTDTSTNTPTSWSWNFGDGTTSTTQNPTHRYSSAGTYTVTHAATNTAGSNTITHSVVVFSS